MPKIRLHQFLSKTGEFSSKNDILQNIKNFKIKVDDKVITNPHYQLSKNRAVHYKGKKLTAKEKIYIILNKPAGFLSSRLSKNDVKLNKKSIFSLIKNLGGNLESTLSTIGRLDEDTSGLIILTNDGKLIHKIAHPKFSIPKTYLVELERELSNEDKTKVESGVVIELEENGIKTKYKTKPSKINKINKNYLHITINEGKKREIRRMFESVKNKVIKLKRVCIGNLNLEELNIKKGDFKIVNKEFLLNKLNLAKR